MSRRALPLLLLAGCYFDEPSACPPGLAPIDVTAISVEDNVARLDIGYGGGCETHEFAVWWSGAAGLSAPPVIPLEIQHYDHGDACEAYAMHPLYIDLSTLAADAAHILFVQGNGGVQQQLGGVTWTRSPITLQPDDPDAEVLSIDRSCGVIGT